MTKGTPSRGKMHKTLHIACRRCGKTSYHKKTKICSSCGFGKSAKKRSYTWQTKKNGEKRR